MSAMNDDKPWQQDADDREWAKIFRRPGDEPAECPSPDLIQAARSNVLSPQLRDAVSAHVAGCLTCRVLAESFDAITDDGPTAEESGRMLDRIHAATGATIVRTARFRLWPSLAAAAVLTAIVGWWLTGSTRGKPATSVLQVQAPVLLPLESSVEAAEAADLAVALVPYRAGRFDEATKLLATYTRTHPHNAYGYFYLGVAELMQTGDREALAALESAEGLALDSPLLQREIGWHLAVAYRRLGKNDRALPVLARLCEGRLLTACAGLRELAPVMNIRGAVTDADGRALAGVRIVEHVIRMESGSLVTEPTPFATETDARGRYRLSGAPASQGRRVLLRASYEGQFTANASVSYAPDATADFVLSPLRVVPIGQSIRSATATGPLCDPTELCQRYAVTPDRAGTLEVSLAGANREGLDLYVETPDGRVYGPLMGAPLRLSFPVTAGSTLQIRVLDNKRAGEFELRTQLR